MLGTTFSASPRASWQVSVFPVFGAYEGLVRSNSRLPPFISTLTVQSSLGSSFCCWLVIALRPFIVNSCVPGKCLSLVISTVRFVVRMETEYPSGLAHTHPRQRIFPASAWKSSVCFPCSPSESRTVCGMPLHGSNPVGTCTGVVVAETLLDVDPPDGEHPVSMRTAAPVASTAETTPRLIMKVLSPPVDGHRLWTVT